MPGPRTDKVGVGRSKETRTGGSIREGSIERELGQAACRACDGQASKVEVPTHMVEGESPVAMGTTCGPVSPAGSANGAIPCHVVPGLTAHRPTCWSALEQGRIRRLGPGERTGPTPGPPAPVPSWEGQVCPLTWPFLRVSLHSLQVHMCCQSWCRDLWGARGVPTCPSFPLCSGPGWVLPMSGHFCMPGA